MDNFYTVAVMLIYKDGSIDKLKINDKVFHMQYFAHLYKKSSKLKKIILENDLEFWDEEENVSNLFTYQLDLCLVNQNVIAIHNLNIKEIQTDPKYLQNNIPKFIFTMPNELSIQQKEVLRKLFFEADVYDSEFLLYLEDHFESIDYEGINDLIRQKKY